MSESNIAISDESSDVGPLSESNPRHIMNLVPKRVSEAIRSLVENNPELHKLSEEELRDMTSPSLTSDRLRIAFWKEYYRAQDKGSRMMMSKVYGPVMSDVSFYDAITDPKKVAWLICPPSEYMIALEADLNYAHLTNAKILRMNLFKDGELKIEEAKLWMKAYQSSLIRVHGAVIQKLETKNLHAHVGSTSVDISDPEIKKEYELLKSKHQEVVNQSVQITDVRDVTDDE